VVRATASESHGDIQFTDETDGSGVVYGPIRLSGHFKLGNVSWDGDLISGQSALVQQADIPPLAMSGSDDGHTVGGTCSGSLDPTLDQATTAYDLSCTLGVDGAAPTTLALRTVFTRQRARCSGRICWSDDAGWFVAG